MVKTIKALDYRNEVVDEKEIEINEDIIIYVQVVSGDEIIRVLNTKTLEIEAFLDGGGRMMSFFDGEYVVPADEFDKWMERTNVYDALKTFIR